MTNKIILFKYNLVCQQDSLNDDTCNKILRNRSNTSFPKGDPWPESLAIPDVTVRKQKFRNLEQSYRINSTAILDILLPFIFSRQIITKIMLNVELLETIIKHVLILKENLKSFTHKL